jgi:hypothetical protein
MTMTTDTLVVEQRTFSEDYSRHWFALMNAQGYFMKAMLEYGHGPRAGSPGKWRLAKRRFATLENEMQKCLAYVGRLFGSEQLTTPSEQDQHEGQILEHFLSERAFPFISYWQEAIDAVDGGEAFMVKADDIPPWTDDERSLQ